MSVRISPDGDFKKWLGKMGKLLQEFAKRVIALVSEKNYSVTLLFLALIFAIYLLYKISI